MIRILMPKTYNDIIKQQAWTYYVIIGMNAEEISGILEPSAKTINQWAADGGWDKQKAIRLTSPNKIAVDALWNVQMIYQVARDEGRGLSSKEIDMVSKHNKMIEKLDKNFAFTASVIEGMGRFMQMVREKDEKLFQELIPYNLEFTESLAKNFGGI